MTEEGRERLRINTEQTEGFFTPSSGQRIPLLRKPYATAYFLTSRVFVFWNNLRKADMMPKPTR